MMTAFCAISANAQTEGEETGFTMTIGVDNSTAYNWRGSRQSEKPFGYNVMPSLCFTWTGDVLGAEIGVYDTEEIGKSKEGNRFNEFGVWATFSFFNFDLQFQSYGLNTLMWNKDYDYRPVYELGLSYTFSKIDFFQPKLSWYTIVGGDDFRWDVVKVDGEWEFTKTNKRAFSSYLELDLPFYIADGNVLIGGVLGLLPFYAPYYSHYENRARLCNAGIYAGYTFDFNCGISIPIKAEFGYSDLNREEMAKADGFKNKNGLYYGLTVSINWTTWLGR